MSKYLVTHKITKIQPEEGREFKIDAIFGDLKIKKAAGDDPNFGAMLKTEVDITTANGKKIATFTFEQLRNEDGTYAKLLRDGFGGKKLEVFKGGTSGSFKGIFEKAAAQEGHVYEFLIEKGYNTGGFMSSVAVHNNSLGQLKIHDDATKAEITELASFFSSSAIAKDDRTPTAQLFVIEAAKEKANLPEATHIDIKSREDGKLLGEVSYPGKDWTGSVELHSVEIQQFSEFDS